MILIQNTKCKYNHRMRIHEIEIYSFTILKKHAKVLNAAEPLGYDALTNYHNGYIDALYKNKLINKNEFKWLKIIYVTQPTNPEGTGHIYKINKHGQVEDYSDSKFKSSSERLGLLI